MNIAIASALHGLLVLVGFLVVVRLWRESNVDAHRRRLFEIRDQLFSLAADGQVPFDDPEYVTARSRLNEYIRWAHVVSTPRLAPLLCASVSPAVEVTFERAEVVAAMRRAHNANFAFIVVQAPALLALASLVALWRQSGTAGTSVDLTADAPQPLDLIESAGRAAFDRSMLPA
jgi:hypothetical protein